MRDFTVRLNEILEGWEEVGIPDPHLTTPLRYTDQEISRRAPRPYGLAFYDNEPIWDAMRRHPDYITQVRLAISQQKEMIDNAKQGRKPSLSITTVKDLPGELQRELAIAADIARDIGWKDARDVLIAVQRHPFVAELLDIRDELVRKKGL